MTVFDAKLSSLHAMVEFVRKEISKAKLPLKEKRQLEIGLEEALVNIIRYAYPKPGGKIELRVHLIPGKIIEIQIRDQGMAFNPLEKEITLDKDAPLEKREVGGLGICFMKEFIDAIDYKREENSNLLILKKLIL